MKYYPGEPVPPWRVGEFKSSSEPRKLVIMVAVGLDEIAGYGAHKDFVRWLSPDPTLKPLGEATTVRGKDVERKLFIMDGDKPTIFFKTGRVYTSEGQRIGAMLLDNGGILFADIDRNIAGYFRPEVVKDCGLTLTASSVMWGYDRQAITQYWEAIYVYDAELKRLQEATRAHTDW